MTTQLLRRRFTVDEYYRMAQAGILTQDDRVELIDGEIVEMAPLGSRPAATVARLTMLFSRLGNRAIIRVQNPIHLGERSELQPDLTLPTPRPDYYASAHPGPEDVLLVVEVADTSLEYDREVKVPLYARAGISETWLVDLAGETMEVYRRPSMESYLHFQKVQRGERLSPEAFPDLELSAYDILGPAR